MKLKDISEIKEVPTCCAKCEYAAEDRFWDGFYVLCLKRNLGKLKYYKATKQRLEGCPIEHYFKVTYKDKDMETKENND